MSLRVRMACPFPHEIRIGDRHSGADDIPSVIGIPVYRLHIFPGAYKGLMRDLDKALEEQTEDAEAHVLGAHGGSREQGDNVTLKTRGNQADDLARRIARDHLALVDRRSSTCYDERKR